MKGTFTIYKSGQQSLFVGWTDRRAAVGPVRSTGFFCYLVVAVPTLKEAARNTHTTGSHQVVLLQIQLQNSVLNCREYKSDVLCICGGKKRRGEQAWTGGGVKGNEVRGGGQFTCGACEVGVDDLVWIWVQIHKHLEDELSGCLSIFLWT